MRLFKKIETPKPPPSSVPPPISRSAPPRPYVANPTPVPYYNGPTSPVPFQNQTTAPPPQPSPLKAEDARSTDGDSSGHRSYVSSAPISSPGPPPETPVERNIEEEIKAAITQEDGSTSLAKKVAEILSTVPGHWSGRGQHAEFGRSENIPLQEGRYLGQGAYGDVYETSFKGLPVARKRVRFGKRVRVEDVKREVEILQRLSHHHIINLLGTYTQTRTVGLLLLPVADCDLGEFMEALDDDPSDEHATEICTSLGLDLASKHSGKSSDPIIRLRSNMGCIANAIEYLHKSKIKHKDIKTRNILLKKDVVIITDFGVSKDVSEESLTTSNGIEIGTFKYCAPEAALQLPRGRAADIFSLGCVFSQMIAIIKGESLAKFDDVLKKDEYSVRSFQGNLDRVLQWQEHLRSTSTSSASWSESQLFHLINTMMRKDPESRPNASQVCLTLYSLGVDMELQPSPYHGSCCPPPPSTIHRIEDQNVDLQTELQEMRERHSELQTKYSKVKKLYFNKVSELERVGGDLHPADIQNIERQRRYGYTSSSTTRDGYSRWDLPERGTTYSGSTVAEEEAPGGLGAQLRLEVAKKRFRLEEEMKQLRFDEVQKELSELAKYEKELLAREFELMQSASHGPRQHEDSTKH